MKKGIAKATSGDSPLICFMGIALNGV